MNQVSQTIKIAHKPKPSSNSTRETQKAVALIAWRFYFLIIVIAALVLLLFFRVFDLAILKQPFLRREGDLRVIRVMSTPAFRGMIVDRNQFPLALSRTVYSIWVSPNTFTASKKQQLAVAKILGLSPRAIPMILNHSHQQNREFVYLKRALSPKVANTIQSLNLPGVYLEKGYRRYYPEGEVAAHVIGLTNVDDQGQEGLELLYNDWLKGELGKKKVIKDRIGRVIADVNTITEQKPGKNLILSIDRRIQYLAYRELVSGILLNNAKSGSAVVLDIKTGEVLAMVNYPSFNPNDPIAKTNDCLRNRSVTDVFEPGSTLKVFSIASVLDSGLATPDTLVDTTPGFLKVGHNIVRDEHPYGVLSVSKILQKSSNVGVTKLILSLPKDQLWSLLHRVGFGELTGLQFPGERSGSLIKRHPIGDFTLATLAFGYGISVTPLQLARAYAVIANHGIKMPVSLLYVNKKPPGERVMAANIAKQMLLLLESVVNNKDGTGKLANVPGYRIAGKTGTAKIVGPKGYEKRYVASFVGIAPVSNPRLVVAVIVHEPDVKGYHGGEVSAPIFEQIMEGTLRILDITPDLPKTFAGFVPIDDTKGRKSFANT